MVSIAGALRCLNFAQIMVARCSPPAGLTLGECSPLSIALICHSLAPATISPTCSKAWHEWSSMSSCKCDWLLAGWDLGSKDLLLKAVLIAGRCSAFLPFPSWVMYHQMQQEPTGAGEGQVYKNRNAKALFGCCFLNR